MFPFVAGGGTVAILGQDLAWEVLRVKWAPLGRITAITAAVRAASLAVRRARWNRSARMVAHTKRMLYAPGSALERYGRFKAGAQRAGECDCPEVAADRAFLSVL